MIALTGGLAVLTWQASAQDGADTIAAPQLPYEATQVLQLEQAKVSDDTVIAYIENSGSSYHLEAGQILYLRHQGVSDAVLTAMLTQPKTGGGTPTTPMPAAPTPQPAVATSATYATITPSLAVQPTVTYVQTVPTASYYYAPYYYPPYRYYAWPRPVVAVGWGRWRGWHVGVAW